MTLKMIKKVLQSTVTKGSGDCARAVMASIFNKELEDMPLFFPDTEQAWNIMKYFQSKGYEPTYFDRQPIEGKKTVPSIEVVAKYDGGVNGYFYASVPSQTFEGGSHAVVVDIDLNIVHDPNPNQLALKLKPEDVKQIITLGTWTIDFDGNIIEDEESS